MWFLFSSVALWEVEFDTPAVDDTGYEQQNHRDGIVLFISDWRFTAGQRQMLVTFESLPESRGHAASYRFFSIYVSYRHTDKQDNLIKYNTFFKIKAVVFI